METIKNYINGELTAPKSGDYLPNFCPIEGSVYCQIPDSDDQDVQKAVESAKSAFPLWKNLTNHQRASFLHKIANEIEKQLDDFALAETRDNGKPLKISKNVDIPRAITNFKFYAGAIEHFASESHKDDQNYVNYTLREPIGVAACISPWNLPLYLFSWKIAPALATGNTVVAKPSEITPYTAYLLSKVCQKVGLPKGVLNIVHGLGNKAGNALVSHPDTPLVSFTGGTKTGAHIAKTTASMFKKLSLELGGKNPTVIFSDCDFENAVNNSVKAAYMNQGEICLCGSRIYVHQSIYSKFKKAFVEKMKTLTVGNPLQDETKIGAIVSQQHFEKILSYIDLAKKEGGTLLFGGQSVQPPNLEKGWYIQPTLFENLGENCRTNQEEIFGPVATLQSFETDEEAVRLANATRYGLSASIWTKDLGRAHRVAANVKAGILWINCWLVRDLRTPFGGMKQSGVGREGGWEAMRFFTEPKNICISIK